MRRKFLSVVLCVCMMLTMVPFAFAVGTDTGSNAEGTDTTIPADTDTDTTGGSGSSNDSSSSSPTSLVEVSTADALQDALSAAKDGTIIKLTDNITVTARAVFSGQNMTVTLDLNNHTLTGPDNDYALDNSNNNNATTGKLIVKDGTIQRADNVKGSNSTVRNYGEMELNNVQVNGNYIVVKNEETATLSMNSCTLTAPNTYVDEDNQSLIPSGLLNWGTATATDSTINAGDAVFVSSYINNDSTTTLTNCTVVGTSDAIYSGRFDTSSASQTVTINDGNYTGDVYSGAGSVITINTTVSGDLSVVNNFECVLGSAQYISSGPSKTTIGENGSISGTIKAAAKNGNTYYSTITNAIEAASTNATIELVQDTIEDVTVPAGKTVTLNLNGKKLTNVSSNTITNNGTLIITGTGTVDNVTHQKAALYNKGTATLEGGTFDRTKENGKTKDQSGNNSWYTIKNVGTMTVKDGVTVQTAGNNNSLGKFSSLVSNGYFNNSDFTNNKGIDNPNLTIEGGNFLGGLNTIKNDDRATLTINNGTFSNYYQAVVQNHNIAEIKGGTFTAASDASSTTFGVDNCGCAEGTDLGTLTISGGTFAGATYAVFDRSTQSPNITISAGNFAATKASIAKSTTSNATISVTGGYFTTDPTAYIASGYAAKSSDKVGYAYMVAKKENNEVIVKPAVATPSVTLGSNISSDNAEAVKTSAQSVKVPEIANAAAKNVSISSFQAEQYVNEANLTPSAGQEVILYVQSFLDVTPTAYDENNKTYTLNITPKYQIVASTATTADQINLNATATDKNAVVVKEATVLNVTEPTQVSLNLPADFVSKLTTGGVTSKVYVKHVKDNGKTYIYEATLNDNTLTFINPHGFSEFTITTTAPVATVDGIGYESLQDAVDAAANGATIVLNSGASHTLNLNTTKSVTVENKTGDKATITFNGTQKEIDNSSKETFSYTRPSSGSGSTSTTYDVKVNAATNGAVAADKKTASKGTTVTVTASPSKGYVVDAVKVVDKDGKDVAVTGKDGKYVFTMPGSAVTVTGTFKAETPAPAALPFTDVKSGNWFYDAVKYAYEQGLMTGTSATTFAPNGTMNRAMIVTVLYRLEKSPAVTGASKFTDVPAGQWYSDAVAWAAANKIVNGYDETTFGPMNAVTREQMAAILFRYEQVKGLENVTLEENLNRFPDQNKISAYAIPALQWAVGQKIINGNADGTLDPTGTATRAQVAQIFTNLLNK